MSPSCKFNKSAQRLPNQKTRSRPATRRAPVQSFWRCRQEAQRKSGLCYVKEISSDHIAVRCPDWLGTADCDRRTSWPFVPAGTLLGCTLDEPNFSSQTARVGDPALCKTTASIVMFGHSLIPRGAYLSGRLKNYRDPGHFVGKGWIQLEFTSLTLPGGSVPLDAKVISAARYRVNGDGKIQGRGHATRDAVEWAIPVLWPVKVLTLTARGPRPTLKSETRIELRLMEDLLIPESVYATSSVLTLQPSAVQPGADVRDAIFWRGNTRPPIHQAVTSTSTDQSPATNRGLPSAQPRLTLLILRGGRVYLVSDYWVERGNLDYITGSAVHALPLVALDLPMTKQLNAERGVPFTLATKER